jgi:hypothetical protein
LLDELNYYKLLRGDPGIGLQMGVAAWISTFFVNFRAALTIII